MSQRLKAEIEKSKNEEKEKRSVASRKLPPLRSPPATSTSTEEKSKDSNSKTIEDSSSSNPMKQDIKDDTSKDNVEPSETVEQLTMADILDDDEKMLFTLKVLGSLEKHEKLKEEDELLAVDDRWWFQGAQRWLTGDSRTKSAERIFALVTDVDKRIHELLDEEYVAKVDAKANAKAQKEMETMEEKRIRERNEWRDKRLQEFLLGLSVAKKGIENARETYDVDKTTRAKFDLTLDKLSDSLNQLRLKK
jgi:hypothetical protein